MIGFTSCLTQSCQILATQLSKQILINISVRIIYTDTMEPETCTYNSHQRLAKCGRYTKVVYM